MPGVPTRTVPMGRDTTRSGGLRIFPGRATIASGLAVVLAALTAVLAPVPAAAVVPGTNGPIVFTRLGEISVMNADGTNQTRLATGTEPAFSPDATRIAFTDYRDGNAEIYVMNADGTVPTRRTGPPPGPYTLYSNHSPVFSPDGTRIAFVGSRMYFAVPPFTPPSFFDFGIYVMNADGTGRISLTTGQNFDSSPDWGVSPGGALPQTP